MDDDSRAIDKGWDALPNYADKSGEADDAVTVSLSTTPGEWLVNTVDAVVVPMSMAELVDALQKRKLTERSLVWRAGMQEWAPVDRVPQLKLAARLPIDAAPSTPPPSTAPRPSVSSKAPPKPAHATPVPSAPPPAVSLPSRKATLPFGLPTPPASRPAHARPSSGPRAAAVSPSEDTGVLAVYERPAATISFDISPEKPLRAESVAPPRSPQLQTLAPLTSDSTPRRLSQPPSADLSVVAAAHFRQAQRSSKRLVVTSSIVSAAAASLLTFWLAHSGDAPSSGLAAPPAPVTAAPLPPTPTLSEPAKTEPLPPPTPESSAAPPTAPVASAPAKPKPHRPRAPRPTSVAARPTTVPSDGESVKQPSAEPNPYDVKLEDDAPKAKPTLEPRSGSGLDDKPSEGQTASGSASPGF